MESKVNCEMKKADKDIPCAGENCQTCLHNKELPWGAKLNDWLAEIRKNGY